MKTMIVSFWAITIAFPNETCQEVRLSKNGHNYDWTNLAKQRWTGFFINLVEYEKFSFINLNNRCNYINNDSKDYQSQL